MLVIFSSKYDNDIIYDYLRAVENDIIIRIFLLYINWFKKYHKLVYIISDICHYEYSCDVEHVSFAFKPC